MQKQISHYNILSKIASGGMSEVYLANDTKTGKKVALKILDTKLSIDPEYLNRFKKEASICQQLEHKNIVKILSYGAFKESYYIAYEYIEGITLEKLIRQNALTIEEIENISIQILEALSYAHSKSIIHRDIKPSNIIIESGDAKILDFGIAKQELASTVTKAGLFMGSPHYVSPEQIEGHDIDCRSDLYSFGIVLYEMIEGHVPFSADTPWGIIRAHLDKKVPEITKDIPGYLKEVVCKCLSKTKEGRFSSANEVISDITNKEEKGKKTVIIDIAKIKPSPSINKEKPKTKFPIKISLAISLPVIFISLWFLTGGIFYTFGNKYLKIGNYLDAAINYKASGIFLIPNAAYNVNYSLDQEYAAIIKLLNEGKYADVADGTNLLKENFPDYEKINDVANTLEELYSTKKQQYEKYLANEDYDNAKTVLAEMEAVKLGNSTYTKTELEELGKLIQVKNLIIQANTNFSNKNYKIMHQSLEGAKVILPEYPRISELNSKIESRYLELKSSFEKYFADSNFKECILTLNEMIAIRKGNDSFAQGKLLAVDLYIESDNYITQANDLAGNQDFNGALNIINEAIGKNPDYVKLSEVKKDINTKKLKNATYLAKIDDIQNILGSGDILTAYSQAEKLLKSSDFTSIVKQSDITRLKNIKNAAYEQGKNTVANNVSFNLYESYGWQSKNINNIFGVKMYQIGFGGWSIAADNSNGFVSFAVSVGNNWEKKLLLLTGDKLERTSNGENAIAAEKRENPGAFVDIARNGQSYTVSAENRIFVITINSMGVDDYWFSSLNISVNAQ